MAAFLREILSMKSFCEFLLGSCTYRLYLACEVECLACHRMVEVHGHGLLAYSCDYTLDNLSASVEHRDHVADYKQVLTHYAVDCKGSLREVDHVTRVVCTISVLRGENEIKSLARLLALNCFLELREEHAGAMDILQRLLRACFVCDIAFYFQFVAYCYNFVLFCFHCI